VQFFLAPMLARFREQHPCIEVEVVAEDRFVDIVAEGYDAGVRLAPVTAAYSSFAA
jgi:DNA-binding transcriptional LysR family regulator